MTSSILSKRFGNRIKLRQPCGKISKVCSLRSLKRTPSIIFVPRGIIHAAVTICMIAIGFWYKMCKKDQNQLKQLSKNLKLIYAIVYWFHVSVIGSSNDKFVMGICQEMIPPASLFRRIFRHREYTPVMTYIPQTLVY